MSTQFYTEDQQATSQQATGHQGWHQPRSPTAWRTRRNAAVT